MTEYNEAVERQRDILAAEKWGEGVNYILAQEGYIEMSYNNGKRTREYHRGPKKGHIDILDHPMSIDELVISMGQHQADANIR